MPSSTRSSNASASCRPPPKAREGRLDWPPSRGLAAALALIGLLAAVAVLNCELPRPWAWPLAAVAALYGAWLARRELRRPPQALVVAAGRFHLDGVELCQPRLHWRGPLACLSFRQGRRRRYRIGWPDALGATARRELRLAASVITPTPDPRSMAP